MNTVILEKPGRFLFEQTPQPGEPGPDEALVRVHNVGICGTDIHAYGGNQPFFTYPRILGHELGVQIEALGSPQENLQEGDLCAVEPYLNCGHCLACRRGRTNCCEQLQCLGVHCDGGMRENIILPIDKLHRSEKLGLEELAIVETLGIGKHAVDRAQLRSDAAVAVIGLGPIGLTIIQFATLAGVRVVALDVSHFRIETCKALFEVETIQVDPKKPIAGQWSSAFGELPGTVFDATGSPASMNAAFDLPANSGTLVLVGIVTDDITFSDPEFHRKELTVLSSRNSTAKDFKDIIAHMEKGDIDIKPWITHRTPAKELPNVFDDWLKPDSSLIKGLVAF